MYIVIGTLVYLAVLGWLDKFTLENISWAFSAGSIIGAFAVSGLKRWGMVVWLVANSGWLAYDIYHHEYSQVVIFAFFIGSNICGLIKWKKSGIN